MIGIISIIFTGIGVPDLEIREQEGYKQQIT